LKPPLPGELISLLGMLGYNWPEADEEKLFHLGSTWMDFSGTLQQAATDADNQAQKVCSGNSGGAIDAFKAFWSDRDAPSNNLADASTSCIVIGAGLMAAAAVVLALKINVIIQLTAIAIEIAQVIATAVPTFGASLAEIPIFKEIAGLIINMIIDQAINTLLDG
jgi:hypothetical protein